MPERCESCGRFMPAARAYPPIESRLCVGCEDDHVENKRHADWWTPPPRRDEEEREPW